MVVELVMWNSNMADALIKLCNEVNRSYLSDRLPYPYSEADAKWWLDMVSEKEGVEGIFRAICVDGRIVGNISVEKKTELSAKDAEIGYMLSSDEWSKGIMTSATRQICEIAFEKLDIIRITGNVYSPNIPSQRVLLKNDFVLEGVKKNAIYKNGNIYDLFIYGKYR